MAAVKVTRDVAHFWTAFFSLLSAILPAILSALGLKRTPSAAITVYADEPATTKATATEVPTRVTSPAVPAPRCFPPAWVPGVHVRSLPPTIKQRIRAEAHGTSPSVRHLPAQAARPAQTARPVQAARPTQPAGTRKDLADVTDQVHLTDLALAA
ncbi:DUF6344 domain-containing protein [Streptomyces sp. NPDC049837]|uniref:DUF6344 domain-containing protein n=1 Tax=Streptomyces sp. NPDC049837 TaxID=3155277 RepID=UPI00343A2F2F